MILKLKTQSRKMFETMAVCAYHRIWNLFYNNPGSNNKENSLEHIVLKKERPNLSLWVNTYCKPRENCECPDGVHNKSNKPVNYMRSMEKKIREMDQINALPQNKTLRRIMNISSSSDEEERDNHLMKKKMYKKKGYNKPRSEREKNDESNPNFINSVPNHENLKKALAKMKATAKQISTVKDNETNTDKCVSSVMEGEIDLKLPGQKKNKELDEKSTRKDSDADGAYMKEEKSEIIGLENIEDLLSNMDEVLHAMKVMHRNLISAERERFLTETNMSRSQNVNPSDADIDTSGSSDIPSGLENNSIFSVHTSLETPDFGMSEYEIDYPDSPVTQFYKICFSANYSKESNSIPRASYSGIAENLNVGPVRVKSMVVNDEEENSPDNVILSSSDSSDSLSEDSGPAQLIHLGVENSHSNDDRGTSNSESVELEYNLNSNLTPPNEIVSASNALMNDTLQTNLLRIEMEIEKLILDDELKESTEVFEPYQKTYSEAIRPTWSTYVPSSHEVNIFEDCLIEDIEDSYSTPDEQSSENENLSISREGKKKFSDIHSQSAYCVQNGRGNDFDRMYPDLQSTRIHSNDVKEISQLRAVLCQVSFDKTDDFAEVGTYEDFVENLLFSTKMTDANHTI